MSDRADMVRENSSRRAGPMHFYYLPWQTGQNRALGLRYAHAIAAKAKRSLTVILPSKNHLDEEFKRLHVITTRSGRPLDGSVIAAFYPDVRTMTRFMDGSSGHTLLVVDHAGDRMRPWAEINGARDLATRTDLTDRRPERVREIHEHLEHVGYNGYTSPPGSFSAKQALEELHELGWLDVAGKDYLAAALFARSETAILELMKLAQRINQTSSSFA